MVENILKTDPYEAMLNTDPIEPTLRIEPIEKMEPMLAHEIIQNTLSRLKTLPADQKDL